jgi:hypothetical protein
LLLRQGIDIPYPTLHRYAVAELGYGRRASTIPALPTTATTIYVA